MSIACPIADVPAAAPIRRSAIGPTARSRARSPLSPPRSRQAWRTVACLPVLKHMPGHGRATVDSQHKLPVVDADRAALDATDFAAFRPLIGLPLGMTAHVVFSGDRPDRAGHDFGHYSARRDSRFDRLQRSVDERRYFHGRACPDRLPSARALRSRPAATSSFTARADAGDAGGCRGSAGARRRGASRRAEAALAAKKPAAPIDVGASRAGF